MVFENSIRLKNTERQYFCITFIDQIEPLNIEARYPIHKERLLKSLTEEKCIEILRKTKELQRWIKENL